MNQHYVFRFDDVSLNTEKPKLEEMIRFIRRRCPDSTILLAVSLAVHDMTKQEEELARERVFPSKLHLEWDFRHFYQVDKIGIPEIVHLRTTLKLKIASHGLVHVDHRLLSRKAQELSIVTSCFLLKTDIFVPPFHKWNEKTDEVCAENAIDLKKFTPHAWKHLKYQKFDPMHDQYYFHTHDFTYQQFVERFSR